MISWTPCVFVCILIYYNNGSFSRASHYWYNYYFITIFKGAGNEWLKLGIIAQWISICMLKIWCCKPLSEIKPFFSVFFNQTFIIFQFVFVIKEWLKLLLIHRSICLFSCWWIVYELIYFHIVNSQSMWKVTTKPTNNSSCKSSC